ncbi:MAG: hypothetical protein WCG45_05080 [bacterium]
MTKTNIASITMVGQFPNGIDFHVRNLNWALSDNDHSYIVTTPEIIKNHNLKNKKNCTFIHFDSGGDVFINFWGSFSEIIKEYKIKPNWFLFMEQDIVFFAKPIIPKEEKIIYSFLPRGDYKNILKEKTFFHSRVWEGSNLINSSIVEKAIEKKINFSFSKECLKKYNQYGDIEFSMTNKPDTMDEFGLFCALEENTTMIHETKACHLRGIESIHRLFPDFYKGCSFERLKEIQEKIKYIDVYLVALTYYVLGVWEEINHIDFSQLKENSKKDLKRILKSNKTWLNKSEIERLTKIENLLYF